MTCCISSTRTGKSAALRCNRKLPCSKFLPQYQSDMAILVARNYGENRLSVESKPAVVARQRGKMARSENFSRRGHFLPRMLQCKIAESTRGVKGGPVLAVLQLRKLHLFSLPSWHSAKSGMLRSALRLKCLVVPWLCSARVSLQDCAQNKSMTEQILLL